MPARQSVNGRQTKYREAANRSKTPNDRTAALEKYLSAKPNDLTEDAARFWDRFAPLAVELGSLNDFTLDAYQRLAEAAGLEADLKRDIEAARLAGDPKAKATAVRLLQNHAKNVRTLLGDFGLSPHSGLANPNAANPLNHVTSEETSSIRKVFGR